MKKQLPARVAEETQKELKEEAKEQNRSFSNHVDTILTKHIAKRKQAKHQSKKEYNGE